MAEPIHAAMPNSRSSHINMIRKTNYNVSAAKVIIHQKQKKSSEIILIVLE